MASAKPTKQFDDTKTEDKQKWEIFRKLFALEGSVSTVTTFDTTLTVGAGFSSSGGQAEQVIAKLFAALPDVRKVAFAAGMKMDSNNLIVVDTDNGWIVEGLAADAYIQTNKPLLSLLVNAAQGVQPDAAGKSPDDAGADAERQAMLNAQWETALANALNGIPSAILSWPVDSATLTVHARHMFLGAFPWTFWTAQSDTSVRGLVRAVFLQLRSKKLLSGFHGICNGIYDSHAKIVEEEETKKAAAKPPEGTDKPAEGTTNP